MEKFRRDLIRYRATHLMRQLWDLYNGKAGWKSASMSTKDAHGGDGIRLTGTVSGPRMFEVKIPALPVRNWPPHTMMLMAHDLQRAIADMSPQSRLLWDEFIQSRQAFDVYRLRGNALRPNEVPNELCVLACRLVSYCQVLGSFK